MKRSIVVGGICFLLGAVSLAMAQTAIRPDQFVALPWNWTATQTFDATHKITGLPSPSSSSDAATKGYVDSAVGGSGTVTSVACGTGLSGGTITTTGTCALDLAHANDWSGIQSFQDGKFKLDGSSSGTTIFKAAATASGTITFPAATDTAAVLGTAQIWTATQSSTPQTLTISTATFTPAVASGNNIKLTLVHASCPCTFANWSGTPVAGTSGVLEVIQSSTGSDTIGTWGSQYVAAGSVTTLTLSTAANAIDFFSYYVIDSTHTLITAAALNATH